MGAREATRVLQTRRALPFTLMPQEPQIDARQEQLLRELAALRGEEQAGGSMRSEHSEESGLFSRLRKFGR